MVADVVALGGAVLAPRGPPLRAPLRRLPVTAKRRISTDSVLTRIGNSLSSRRFTVHSLNASVIAGSATSWASLGGGSVLPRRRRPWFCASGLLTSGTGRLAEISHGNAR